MKKKVLSMLVLLIAVATGAWAGNNGYLYLDLSGTTTTLKCSNNPGENPFYYQGNWNENQYPGDFDEFKSNFISNCTEITVDASCQNYDGNHYIQLFYDWKALKTINNIGNLKTSSITSMYMMFSGCSSLTTLDLSDWDTSSVGDMGAMFLNCENLTTIYVGSNWSIAAVNSSDNMFLGCEKLPGYNANYDNNATYAHTGAGGYLSVKAATPTSYTVSMKEGTEDATNWTITPNPATAGTQVTATYSGTKRVKSVKAVKKVTGPVAHKPCPDDQHPHWIDLGLPSGTLWQCCNEGATAPEGYGEYYNYNDALSHNAPTKDQIDELLANTTSEWTTLNDVNGRWFTSTTNGGKIFLPAAGGRWGTNYYGGGIYGRYWSSALREYAPSNAHFLSFSSDNPGGSSSDSDCSDGLSVRPVRKN